MKIHVYKLIVILSLVFAGKERAFAQVSQLTVLNYSACPCQTITANATWNNVSNISYTLLVPPAGPPQITTGNSFQIFNCSPVLASFVYTLVGVGIFSAAPIRPAGAFSAAQRPQRNPKYGPGWRSHATSRKPTCWSASFTTRALRPLLAARWR